ncbi:hypothetical protein IFR05_017512, partial [Cadophora sp. M221]
LSFPPCLFFSILSVALGPNTKLESTRRINLWLAVTYRRKSTGREEDTEIIVETTEAIEATKADFNLARNGRPTEVPLKLPLRSGHCAPPTVCSLRVPLLGDGVYELEKGFSDRKLRNGDVVKLRLGGILTGVPSALEDDRLMTLFVDYDGWYGEHQGIQQRLSKEVLRVVKTMQVGHKVLIVEKEDRNSEEEKEDRGKET